MFPLILFTWFTLRLPVPLWLALGMVLTFPLQPSNDPIASISFFLSCSFRYRSIWAFQAHSIERFKLISSDVSSLFLLDIIERFKLISSGVSSLFLLDLERSKLSSWHRAFQAHFIERFKLISSGVPSLFLLVGCHWSRLTSGSGLLHRRACSFRAYYTHVVELVLFVWRAQSMRSIIVFWFVSATCM